MMQNHISLFSSELFSVLRFFETVEYFYFFIFLQTNNTEKVIEINKLINY